MARELEAILGKVFDAVDRKDVEALHQVSDDRRGATQLRNI
jgi:hypothetical protein